MEAIIRHVQDDSPRPHLPPLHTRNLSAITVDSASTASSPDGRDDDGDDYFTTQPNDSQSSLGGVPACREVSSSAADLERQHRITPISKLPPELLIAIFTKLTTTADLRNCMLVSYSWALHTVGILWHRPLCNKWHNLLSVVQALAAGEMSFFPYHELVRRLNLSAIADKISDGTVQPFMTCKRVERLTLTNCTKLTDYGVSGLVDGSRHLQALDVTDVESLTDRTLHAVAENCPKLQGLNITNCTNVTDDSLVAVAESCRQLKRLKLNKVINITDQSVVAVAKNCRATLEIDLEGCGEITSESVTALLANLPHLRELRLSQCIKVGDAAFVNLPPRLQFDSLRILDLTACEHVRDEAISRIIPAAPRLRNLVLAKCKHITDRAISSICKLGKNLHYIHLGHCANLSDNAVIALVKSCNRIRYIDLACCSRLTDASVQHLATLPKLRRIGLVKCQNLTDQSIIALAHGITHFEQGRLEPPKFVSSLERVHLSYCVQLTRLGITALLHSCPRLTHLSLTGVQAFLHDELTRFCRDAPAEFTHPQRDVFCVFSGEGVHRLREHLLRMAAEEADRQDHDPETMEELFEGNESPSADTMSDDDITVDGNEPTLGPQADVPTHGIPIVNAPRYPRPRPRSLQSFPPPHHVEPPLFPPDQMTRFGPWTPSAPLTPEMRASVGPPHLHLMSSTANYYFPDADYEFRSRSPALDLGPRYEHRTRSSSRNASRRHTLESSSYPYSFQPQTAPQHYFDSSQRRDNSRTFDEEDRRNMLTPGAAIIPGGPERHGNAYFYLGPGRRGDRLQGYLNPDPLVSTFEANHDAILSTIPRSRNSSRNHSRSNSPHISRVNSRNRMSMLGYVQSSSPAQHSSPNPSTSRQRPRPLEEEERHQAMMRAMMLDAAEQLRETRLPSQEPLEPPTLPPEMMIPVPIPPALPITPVTPLTPFHRDTRPAGGEPARDGEDVQMTQ